MSELAAFKTEEPI